MEQFKTEFGAMEWLGYYLDDTHVPATVIVRGSKMVGWLVEEDRDECGCVRYVRLLEDDDSEVKELLNEHER